LKEIRLHGRGGQGAVSAAELLAVAAFEDGKYGQAFPAFGGERRGAPVQAFVRLDGKPIRLRYRVTRPDYVLIMDSTLLEMVDVLMGLQPGGMVIVDSEHPADQLAWTGEATAYSVPATRIALEVFGQPFVSAPVMGGFAAATGEVSLSAIQFAYRHRFPGRLGEKNSEAAQSGFDWVARNEGVRVAKTRTLGQQAEWASSPGLGAPGRPLHFAAVIAPRTSIAYPTGGWRYNHPVVDVALCNGCGICEMYCPDGCMLMVDKKAVPDYVYCKGCGICADECSRHAITMVVEEA